MNKNRLKKAFIVGILAFFVFQIFRWPIQDKFLNEYGIIMMGIVINKRGYNGTKGHMKKDNIVYCYSFKINGDIYIGDSQSSKYKIGDTIKIIYLENYPSINRPYYYLKK